MICVNGLEVSLVLAYVPSSQNARIAYCVYFNPRMLYQAQMLGSDQRPNKWRQIRAPKNRDN